MSNIVIKKVIAKKRGYCGPCRAAAQDAWYEAGDEMAFMNEEGKKAEAVCLRCADGLVKSGRAEYGDNKKAPAEAGAGSNACEQSYPKAMDASLAKKLVEQNDKIIKLLTAQLKLLCNVHDERYTDYMKEPEAEKQDFTPPVAKEPTPEEIAKQERDRRVAIERAEICSWPPDMYKAYRKRIMNRKPEDEGREIWRTWPAEYAAQQAADENKQQETRFAGKSAPTHHYVNE